MPTPQLQALSKEYKVPMGEMEKFWKIAKEQYNEEWPKVVGAVKKMAQNYKKSKNESNIQSCIHVLSEEVPNTSYIRDALDKVITGDLDELSDKEKKTLLKYKLISADNKPTELARGEFAEMF